MKKKKYSKYMIHVLKPIRCPYCGSSVEFRSADGIYKDNKNNTMLYVCSNYPNCDAYVRTHPNTTIPVGIMANHKLRLMHLEAHKAFDKIHKSGLMTKDESYRWLAYILQKPLQQAHIGYLQEYYCQIVINESKKLLHRRKIPSDYLYNTAFGDENYVKTAK